MSLVQRYALPPEEIERRSLEMVQAQLPELNSWSGEERYVVARIVRAAGDPSLAPSVRFSPGAAGLGVTALQKGATVVTDVRMVEIGISRALLDRCGCATRCAIDTPQVAQQAKLHGTTRAIMAMREMAEGLPGSVVAIGNAPTALLALLDLIDEGCALPSLVIGMPVGFVASAEAKEELMGRRVPFITIRGLRGGSPLAAATVNALLDLAVAGVTRSETQKST